MKCPNCGTENPVHAKFCMNCDQKLGNKEQKLSSFNDEDLMKCPYCAEKIKKGSHICKYCGEKLNQDDLKIKKDTSRRTSLKRTNFFTYLKGKQNRKNQLITMGIIGFIVIASLYAIFPHDQTIKIGTSDYLLSAEAQQYLEIADQSNYPADKYVIIIEEPHYDPVGQYNLYKGIEVFMRDNPSLVNKTVFLAEGVSSNENISVEPLVDVDSNPSDEKVKTVLDSFLITGYIAYAWKYNNNIPILGIENKTIYDASANLWVEGNDNFSTETQNLWEYTVVSRNKNMAKTLINNTQKYKNPILFVGGLHLDSMDRDTFKSSKNSAHTSNLIGTENKGIIDYLEEEKIGYTFIQAKGPRFTSSEDESRYLKLFRAQQSGDYNSYIELIIDEENEGVTVAPSTKAAAKYLATSSGSGHKNGIFKSIGNYFNQLFHPPPPQGNGPLVFDSNKDGGRWKDNKYWYTNHNWGGEPPHLDRGPIDGGRGDKSFDGGKTWKPKK